MKELAEELGRRVAFMANDVTYKDADRIEPTSDVSKGLFSQIEIISRVYKSLSEYEDFKNSFDRTYNNTFVTRDLGEALGKQRACFDFDMNSDTANTPVNFDISELLSDIRSNFQELPMFVDNFCYGYDKMFESLDNGDESARLIGRASSCHPQLCPNGF